MYVQGERIAARRGGEGGPPPSPPPGGIFFRQFKYTQLKICTNHAFLCFFQPFLRFDLWITALSFPYIGHERTAQNLILLVCSSLFLLRSAIAPKIKVRSRAIERFQRAMCPALPFLFSVMVTSKMTIFNLSGNPFTFSLIQSTKVTFCLVPYQTMLMQGKKDEKWSFSKLQ